MALVVEDGTGVTNAEAYASVAFADTYHSNLGNSSWSALNTTQKEVALRQGAQYLDIAYGGRWSGIRLGRSQSLSWPRSYATDDEGYTIDGNHIPDKLKRANCELGLTSLTEVLLPSGDGTIKSQSDKVGGLETSVEYLGGKSVVRQHPSAHYLVRGFLRNDGGEVRRG